MREYLGLDGEMFGRFTNVQSRWVRAWEAGDGPVPERVDSIVDELVRYTDDVLAKLVAELRTQPNPVLVTYRTDVDMRLAEPDAWIPDSGWHRMLAARVLREVPGLRVEYYQAPNP